ncbi:hypothetical protein CLV70_109183 [Pseudosporangium ferrugineum]|uniref:Uncharacterized protein n=1 Tax=Pseudosporangium ferrugineum TaxID=439699 RepID=A0A2T0S3Q4_9ACTN|nr:hypothetical protein CLV70_109183 [Pseudosporangium ferrugineum]
MSTDRATAGRQLQPNLVLTTKREARGWTSRRRAARELHRIWQANLPGCPDIESLEKALYRHETGRVQVRDDAYRKLYCLAYDATPQELFGSVETDTGSASRLVVTSHKFIPVFVGVERAAHLRERPDFMPGVEHWLDCRVAPVDVINGKCDLHVWPFGVAIFHLVEELALPNVAALSVWRVQSYKDNMAWATRRIRDLGASESTEAAYVLSSYWVNEAPWEGDTLDTALRILAIPKVLLERDIEPAHSLHRAELVERSLLAEGFEHPDMIPFGIKGISMGYASWSGVVYYPIAEQRSLAEDDLVHCELAVQSLWAYSDHLNRMIERGSDPVVPDEYGWRFVRGARSRITNARPRETEQHRSMRNAILATCDLESNLAQAIETLRDSAGG